MPRGNVRSAVGRFNVFRFRGDGISGTKRQRTIGHRHIVMITSEHTTGLHSESETTAIMNDETMWVLKVPCEWQR